MLATLQLERFHTRKSLASGSRSTCRILLGRQRHWPDSYWLTGVHHEREMAEIQVRNAIRDSNSRTKSNNTSRTIPHMRNPRKQNKQAPAPATNGFCWWYPTNVEKPNGRVSYELHDSMNKNYQKSPWIPNYHELPWKTMNTTTMNNSSVLTAKQTPTMSRCSE